jgi:transcriptional regulator with XRE-family HTH domain
MADRWRDRLKAAFLASGKSMRAVSLESGCAHNYLFEILETGKEPGMDRLLRVAEALDVSLPWLLYGVEIGPREERLLKLYAMLPEAQQRAMLDLAELANPEPKK